VCFIYNGIYFQIKRPGFTVEQVELCCTSNVLYTQHTTHSGGQRKQNKDYVTRLRDKIWSLNECALFTQMKYQNIHAKVQDQGK
jgi:hypothetical protein